jgi:DNA invertase Pin-like site-specific DNA recombinase
MSKSKRRAAIYARVSTAGQETVNQLRELRAVAKRAGWDVVQEYVDKGISGAKGRDQRPDFDRMCKAAVGREFDVVMAWSVDRLGRSLQDLVGFLKELGGTGRDLYLHQQRIDTTTPAGKALFQMCGVFAEFERGMIQERVRAGLARARAEGKTLGRPQLEAAKRSAIHKARSKGASMRKIAAKLGVSLGSVHKELQEDARAA